MAVGYVKSCFKFPSFPPVGRESNLPGDWERGVCGGVPRMLNIFRYSNQNGFTIKESSCTCFEKRQTKQFHTKLLANEKSSKTYILLLTAQTL